MIGTHGDDELPARSGLAVLLHAAGSSPRALSGIGAFLGEIAGGYAAPALPMALPPGASHAAPLAHLTAHARNAFAGVSGRPRILFGHSLGGLVATLALADGLDVDAVFLYEPIVLACLDMADAGDRAAMAWDRALIDHLAGCVAGGDPEPGVARFIEAYNEVSWDELPAGVRRAIVADADAMMDLTRTVHHCPLALDKLAALDVPALVLSGSRSPEVARRMSRRLARRMPGARFLEIDDAGHFAPAYKSDAVIAAMRPFLKRLA
ncbi:MAG: alpha/beta hydrolase [Hyphomicrobiaceae bacterium]